MSLQRAMLGALSVEYGDIDIEASCRLYVESGYELTPLLRDFLQSYAEVTVSWASSRGSWVNELTTSVEVALEAYGGNIRNYSRRLGKNVVPIGQAFATEECLLLAEDGEVLLAGDAGMQRVAYGFEEAVRLLIANDWDKTFF